MEKKLYAVLTTLIGILLLLPLIGIDALGTLVEGPLAWIVAIVIIILGISGFIKK